MKEQILGILLDHAKIENVTPESNLITDFGLSSFEIAELVCAIEDELDIEIPEKDLIKIKTVGDIYNYVDSM
jgi:acyl carrier protein